MFETKFPPIERAGVAQRAERERRGYGEIDHDELDDAFAGRRVKKKEPPREEPKPSRAVRARRTTRSCRGSPTGNKITRLGRAAVRRVLPRAEPRARRSPTSRANTPSRIATRSWRSGWRWCSKGLHQALRLTREDLDSTITFQELMKFNVLRKV